jgi:energy-coupling factor transporter ATP-binding protein EcfA2
LSRPIEVNGAPASNAGDEFHEAWALGNALKLLDPSTGLTELTVEGVRDAAETNNSANWDGVDCALYFDDNENPENSRVEFIQLKYSVTGQNKSWTLARFCSSTKKTGNNSVARRLADAFKGAIKGRRPRHVEPSLSIKLVTNQPIAKKLQSSIVKAACSKLHGDDYNSLKRATGLGKNQLIQFCKVLVLEGGENARAELREQNTKEISELVLSPVKDMADNLRVRIQELLGPEGNRTVKRDTVLSWFNLGRGQGLFPCEPELGPLSEAIPRSTTETLAREVQKHPLVVLHGKGGCGKTTTARSLETALPVGSRTIVYDCYGAGSYRDPSRPRHSSWQGFTQLSNELARSTNTPLFFPYSERDDMAPPFRQKLETASEIFGRENPGSLLVIIIDAADNIVTHAATQTPPQRCFVDQLVAFTDLPSNVRILITCRTSRLSKMNLPEETKEVLCPAFSLSETRAMIALHGLEGSETEISDFHDLSRCIPRVQTSALAGATSLSDAVDFLRPNGKSLNDLFDSKVREAFDRSGVDIRRSYWCAALDELSAPMPIDVLSRVCELGEGVTEDIVNDLAPNLRIGDRGVEFSNEDFEEYSEHAAKGATEAVRAAIAEILVSERLNSSYAASHLFDALIACGRKFEMGRFLGEKDGTAAISDPIVRRRVDLSRLRAALHIASNDQDEIEVGETIFIGAEAMRTSGKVDELILANSDLSATFLEETLGGLVLNDPEQRSKQGSVLFHLARDKIRQGKPFESRLNLQAAEEWMRQTFNDKNGHQKWNTQRRDVVTRLVTFFALRGWSLVEQDCDRWTSPSFCIALRKWVLSKIVIEFGPSVIPKILGELNTCYHFLAINSLCRAGITPTPQQREQALNGLTKFDLDELGEDEGYGSGPSITAELRSEILFFLEGLVQGGEITLHQSKLILDRLREFGQKNFRKLHLTYPYPVDFYLRTAILTSLSNSEEPDLDAMFTEPERLREEERSEESERDFKLAKERYDEVCGLLPAYKAYASLLVERTEVVVKQLEQITSRLGSTSSRGYQYFYVRNTLRLRATDLLALSNLDEITKAKFLKASLTEHEAFDDHEGQLCAAILHDPSMQSVVADALEKKSEEIGRLHVRATEKSEYLLSIARVFLDFSKDHAEIAFSDALKTAEEVDLEALDILHALCRVVKRDRPDTPETRELLGAFARVVRHAGDLLQSEDGFPLEEALEAVTLSNPPVGAMTASRWGDEGFSTHGSEIRLFLKTTLDMGWLSAPDGYALAQILGDVPPSIEDRILNDLDGVPKDVQNGLLNNIIERKILETTPYSDAHIPDILEELCRSRESVAEAWSQLEQIRHFKSMAPAPQKPDSNRAGVLRPEPTKEMEKDEGKVDWTSVDPLSADAIAEAQEADQKARIFDVKERLLELRTRVRFSDRIEHLNTLVQCARTSRWPDNEIEAIFAALDDWPGRATTEWCASNLPKLTVELGGRTMGYSWYHGEQFAELQARSGLPPEGRRQVVLDLVEQNAAKLGARSLLKLLAEYVSNLELKTADELLARLIDRTEARLNMDDSVRKRYLFEPKSLPTTQSEVASALIYRYLGDIDSRVRWQASHALLSAVQLGIADLIKGVFDHAIGQFNCNYTFPDCPFQEMNAAQQLSMVLAQVSSHHPAIIANHETEILKLWTKNQPHILIGHFLARALDQARQCGANVEVDETNLASMNGSASTRAPRVKDRHSRDFDSHADPGSRFSFDSMDIIPYWYSPACRVFADVSSSELIQVAEEWIVDRWNGHNETSHWKNEPRQSRLKDDDYGLYSARHGSRPTIYRHSVYLQWHGLHMAIGELMKTRALVERGDDHYDTFEGWLERDDTTYPTIWISDLLGTLPLSNRYWEQPEPDREEWVGEADAVDPLAEIIGEDGGLALSQYREHGMYEYGDQAAHSEVRSKAAFVPSKTAPALLRAYAATADYYDVFIPDPDDFEENDGKDSDFSIIPAIQRPLANRDVGVDEEDPRCFKGRGVQVAPSKTVLDVLQIPSGPSWSSSWGVEENGIADLSYSAWSTTPNDSERSMRHRSYSYVDGYRLSVTEKALQESMNALECDLLVTVNLERSIGSEYGKSSKKRTAHKRVEVIRLGRDGTYETRSGHRGTWAKAN